MDLTLRLREATGELHRGIEQLPLARAMVEGRVGREYIRLLQQLVFVHETLERELEARPSLHSVFRPNMARRSALHSDLSAFGAAAVMTPLPETETLMQDIVRWAALTPWMLLGSLYILEGSRMGSMMLVKPLSQALDVPLILRHGLDYHLDGFGERPRAWARFKLAFLLVPLSSECAQQVVEAALRTMRGLYEIYAAVGGPEPVEATISCPLSAAPVDHVVVVGTEAYS